MDGKASDLVTVGLNLLARILLFLVDESRTAEEDR